MMAKQEKQLELWCKENISLYDLMNITIDSTSHGFFKVTLPFNSTICNHINSVHAAFIWATAEMIGGLIGLTEREDSSYAPLLKSMDVKFCKIALTDIFAEAYFSKAEVEKMNNSLKKDGRYDFTLEVDTYW